jgi:hypothetical protein
MKTHVASLVIFLTVAGLVSCSEVKTKEKAAIIGRADPLMCGWCGGWFVYVDSIQYRANIPAAYNTENKRVWIRFKKDESDGSKVQGNWIIITSVRERK